MCFHDETLDRVTSAAAPIQSKTLRQLRALRINGIEPIPTFNEALDAFPTSALRSIPRTRAGLCRW